MSRHFCFLTAVFAVVFVVSCTKAGKIDEVTSPVAARDVVDLSKADSFYAYAEISVPAGTRSVTVQYRGEEGTVNKEVAVTPELQAPADGKSVEPFGRVRLLLEAPSKTLASVYYSLGGESSEKVYALSDLPLDQAVIGKFGKSRYVQVPWNFAYTQDENWQVVETRPADVLFYDSEHNHTLRYRFAYTGNNGPGYFLDDAYDTEDYRVTGEKYNYCGGCGNCPYCMPWGCSCGCGSVNSAFAPSGDTTGGGASQEVPEVPEDVVKVYLPEPAPYVTTDAAQTFYHSSGVVMFDDSWPRKPIQDRGTGAYDYDFNDVVLDYDIEAKVVEDSALESEGWREQVKVALHLRAVGGDQPHRVGLVLEGFDMKGVTSISEHMTLDSYNSGHGELPGWVNSSIVSGSRHSEAVPMRPVIEMASIFRFREKVAGEEYYTYTNNGRSHQTVFNRCWDETRDWKDASQYSPELETMSLPKPLSQIQDYKFYNTVPGYVNVSGGLYTYTVIYNISRAGLSPEEREAVKRNMIEAVVNTTSQNFYIVKKDFSPVGLRGYEPYDGTIGGSRNYREVYEAQVAENASELDTSTTYLSSDGQVWGIKCPPLTRHAWEKLYFGAAYPHYGEWVASGGKDCPDWYVSDVDGRMLSCWW